MLKDVAFQPTLNGSKLHQRLYMPGKPGTICVRETSTSYQINTPRLFIIKETPLPYQPREPFPQKPTRSKPYDNAWKAFLANHIQEALPFLIDPENVYGLVGSEIKYERCDSELLKPPLSVDSIHKIFIHKVFSGLQVEFQTLDDEEMDYRMIEYFGILYRKYKVPIIARVIYAFRRKVKVRTIRVIHNGRDVYDYSETDLWKLDVHWFKDTYSARLYAITPTMMYADFQNLSDALEKLDRSYQTEREAFREELRWFDLFLERTSTVSKQNKKRIWEKMEQYTDILAQGHFAKKMRKQFREEGKAEGRVEGEAKGLGEATYQFVSARFPSLAPLAEQRVSKITRAPAINQLFLALLHADDEKMARVLLEADYE